MDWLTATLALGNDLRVILEIAGAIVSAILGVIGGAARERHRARKTSTSINRRVER